MWLLLGKLFCFHSFSLTFFGHSGSRNFRATYSCGLCPILLFGCPLIPSLFFWLFNRRLAIVLQVMIVSCLWRRRFHHRVTWLVRTFNYPYITFWFTMMQNYSKMTHLFCTTTDDIQFIRVATVLPFHQVLLHLLISEIPIISSIQYFLRLLSDYQDKRDISWIPCRGSVGFTAFAFHNSTSIH